MSQSLNNIFTNDQIPTVKKELYDIVQINTFLPNKRAAYDYLSEVKNLFLPNYKSRAITTEYLKGVLAEDYESFSRNDIRIPYSTKLMTCFELLHALAPLCSKPLGFNEDQLPDKFWLMACLYSKNPNHSFFKKITDTTITRELPVG